MESKDINIKVTVDTTDAKESETTINHDEVIGKALMGYHILPNEEPVTVKQFKDVARCILKVVDKRKENI